jgi:hypothetical protein
MGKSERKLTKNEQKRMKHFDDLCAQMEQNGYTVKNRTVGVVKANVAAIFLMLPFMALTAWIYYAVNRTVDVSWEIERVGPLLLLWLLIYICLVVLHELIHGATWGIFAKSHLHSIEFGVIWSALTPYCTCSEPMKKWQYLLGSVMPTLILGFGLAAVGTAAHSFFLFTLAEIMILGGGGDFLIILKMLCYRAEGKETVYYDHPSECGFVVFEK